MGGLSEDDLGEILEMEANWESKGGRGSKGR